MTISNASPESPNPPSRGCSARAVATGLLAAAFMAVAIPYGDMVIMGSKMGVWNTNPGSIFLFFLIVAILNVGLGVIRRSLALDRSELAVVYIMLLIANTLPARGFAGYVPPVATGAFYHASPENNWKEHIHPFLPTWSTVRDPDAVLRFYEGDLENPAIPWDLWIGPLAYWLAFGLALYVVMVSVAVILRKQWVEHERLVFPMMQLPLHMLRGDDQTSGVRPFFRQASMWIGFAIPCVVGNLDALNHYFPHIPAVTPEGQHWGTSIGGLSLFRNNVNLNFAISFTMIGFSYFISRNIAAGLCFFYVLTVIEQGIFDILGLSIEVKAVGIYGHYVGPIVLHQAMGGMIVLVLMGLWNARSHLGAVMRKAFTGTLRIDDSGEMMSYRQAVFGCLAGLLVMGIWLWQAGVPPMVIPVLFFGCFVVFLTITRVVVEGGVAVMTPPMVGPDLVASTMGSRLLGAKGAAGLSTTYTWATDVLILLMTACSNGLKVADLIGARTRRLFWAVMATIAITILLSLWMRLDACYTHGAINLNRFYAFNAALNPYNFMHKAVASPVGPNVDGWIQIGIGGLLMLAFSLAHYRFHWWPFHPLGFPISSTFGSMWFSLFVSLLIKSVVLRYGGPMLYRRTIPFFLGLILGEIVTAGCWLVIDFFTGAQGNVLGSFLH